MTMELRDQIDQAPERRRRLGMFLLVPLALAAGMSFIGARHWSDALVIEKVSVEGARILAAKDVVAMSAIVPPAYMFGTDLYTAQEKLLAQPFIKSAVVIRDLPHTLRIIITERVPIASLAGNEIRYVDAEGVVLPRLDGANMQFDLPVISGLANTDTARYGTVLNDTDLAQAIEVLRTSQETGFSHAISEVHMAPGEDIVLYSTDGGVQVLLGRGEMAKKIVTLQTFWSDFMKPDTLALMQYIDARFDGQIVVRRLAQHGARHDSAAPKTMHM